MIVLIMINDIGLNPQKDHSMLVIYVVLVIAAIWTFTFSYSALIQQSKLEQEVRKIAGKSRQTAKGEKAKAYRRCGNSSSLIPVWCNGMETGLVCKVHIFDGLRAALYPGLGYSAMRHIHQLLKQCLDQAVRDGLILQNPAKAFRYPDKKTVNAEPLTAAEVEAYLDAAEELGHLPMFLLELTTGLHQRELIALKWSDLNPVEHTLTIWEERIVERRELVEYGNRKRTIMLTEEVVKQLEHEHAKHPSSPLMFIHPGTLKPYSPNMVRLLHSKISEKAGLDHVRFEDLRHTYAVNALQNGAKVKELAHTLGLERNHTVRKHYGQYMLKGTRIHGKATSENIDLDELKQASSILSTISPINIYTLK